MAIRLMADCDECDESYAPEGAVACFFSDISVLKEELEQAGWVIGEKILCPKCKSRANPTRLSPMMW